MNWQTRIVLGLLWMGYTDMGRMCEILSVTEARVVESLRLFVADLLSSKQHVIRSALAHGLPGDCATELPLSNTIRCQRCGSRINIVPCVLCSQRIGRDDGRSAAGQLSRTPLESTADSPGTAEKIETMRLRVSRGESPFHPQDVVAPVAACDAS